MKKAIALLILSIAILGCKSTEEPISNSLLGVVYDNKSNPVQNATLTILNENGDLVTKVNTDIDGRFLIPSLEFSKYTVEVRAEKTLFLTTTFDHFDIENVLIIKVYTFDDLITDLEINLKENKLQRAQQNIMDASSVDPSDIYLNYLRAIYFVKIGDTEEAKNILMPLKKNDIKYVDILLNDIDNMEKNNEIN